MLKKIPFLLSALFLLALNCFATATNARSASVQALVSSRIASVDVETDRSRDGLQGPVRRVRTETSKLMSKSGKLIEGARVVLETATYDLKGAKIDTAYFPGAGGALTGREVYKYDDQGNIVEMTLFNTDGSVLSKEKYEYDFDAVGNWTKMTTSVAVVENGQMSFEPTEVTYRIIGYYLEDATAKKLQTASLSNNTNVAANVTPASMLNDKPAAPASSKPDPVAAQPKMAIAPATANAAVSRSNAAANTAVPNVKRNNNVSALPTVSGAHAASSTLTLGLPNAAVHANHSAAPVVKTDDELPPPPAKPLVRAPVRPVSGGVLNGKALQMPKPVYPETARHARVMGVVSVEVVIDVTGRVIGARAVSGPELLRDAAERAARQARFTPATVSGQPVKVSGIINYNFSL